MKAKVLGVTMTAALLSAAASVLPARRVVITAPDTVLVGDTLPLRAETFNILGRRQVNTRIEWQMEPTDSAFFVLGDSASKHHTVRIRGFSEGTKRLWARWVMADQTIGASDSVLIVVPKPIVTRVRVDPIGTVKVGQKVCPMGTAYDARGRAVYRSIHCDSVRR